MIFVPNLPHVFLRYLSQRPLLKWLRQRYRHFRILWYFWQIIWPTCLLNSFANDCQLFFLVESYIIVLRNVVRVYLWQEDLIFILYLYVSQFYFCNLFFPLNPCNRVERSQFWLDLWMSQIKLSLLNYFSLKLCQVGKCFSFKWFHFHFFIAFLHCHKVILLNKLAFDEIFVHIIVDLIFLSCSLFVCAK